MERLTLDSSVFVAALRDVEESHSDCKKLLAQIVQGKYEAVEPFTVLIEVVAAIRRRTGSKSIARRVKENLLSIETITFEELLRFQAEKAADLAVKIGVRGMDALVIQMAKENNSLLVSLDKEMVKLVNGVVDVKAPEDLI